MCIAHDQISSPTIRQLLRTHAEQQPPNGRELLCFLPAEISSVWLPLNRCHAHWSMCAAWPVITTQHLRLSIGKSSYWAKTGDIYHPTIDRWCGLAARSFSPFDRGEALLCPSISSAKFHIWTIRASQCYLACQLSSNCLQNFSSF